jgi:hypothetical protein
MLQEENVRRALLEGTKGGCNKRKCKEGAASGNKRLMLQEEI